jgi:hypothetical protein
MLVHVHQAIQQHIKEHKLHCHWYRNSDFTYNLPSFFLLLTMPTAAVYLYGCSQFPTCCYAIHNGWKKKTNPFSLTVQSGEAMFLFSVKWNIKFAARWQWSIHLLTEPPPGVLILYSNILFLQGENSYAKIHMQIMSMWQQSSFVKGLLVKPIWYFVLLDVFLKQWFLNSYFQLHEDHGHIKSKDQSNP